MVGPPRQAGSDQSRTAILGVVGVVGDPRLVISDNSDNSNAGCRSIGVPIETSTTPTTGDRPLAAVDGSRRDPSGKLRWSASRPGPMFNQAHRGIHPCLQGLPRRAGSTGDKSATRSIWPKSRPGCSAPPPADAGGEDVVSGGTARW